VQHELQLVAAFILPSKRDRYREFLSNPKLRHKFTSKLAHFSDFDPKYRVSIPSEKLFADNIAQELLKRRSPSSVFVISEDRALDQRELPLLEALQQVVGCGMGAVLSCIPGCLAFVETEDERFILARHDPLEKKEYTRFVARLMDGDNYSGQGIFMAAIQALEWKEISGADAEKLHEILQWFGTSLQRPASQGRDGMRHGVCWFKTDAQRHISKIWEIVQVLKRNGIPVKKITTVKPGYIIYEDEWQIVAEPFTKGTFQPK
jgi:hypothetical protein